MKYKQLRMDTKKICVTMRLDHVLKIYIPFQVQLVSHLGGAYVMTSRESESFTLTCYTNLHLNCDLSVA
jgi:hypothetical protein